MGDIMKLSWLYKAAWPSLDSRYRACRLTLQAIAELNLSKEDHACNNRRQIGKFKKHPPSSAGLQKIQILSHFSREKVMLNHGKSTTRPTASSVLMGMAWKSLRHFWLPVLFRSSANNGESTNWYGCTSKSSSLSLFSLRWWFWGIYFWTHPDIVSCK